MAIELKRIGWENSPSTKTPLSKTNLNQMEQNAENAINEVDKKVESNIQDITALDERVTQTENTIQEHKTVIEQNTSNIANIKEEQTEQNNRLGSAETKNVDQDKLIERLQQENTLLKSQIPTGKEAGEDITLTDSSNMPFNKFVVRGKSEQTTRSGKNKFNAKGDLNYPSTFNQNRTTLLSDGTIKTTANYSSWASSGCRLENLNSNTDYILSGELNSSTGAGQLATAIVVIYGYADEKWNNIAIGQIADIGKFSLRFNSGTYTDFFVSLNANGTVGEAYEAIYDKIQVEEGTIATEYEEYGISPSPEYPSRIRNVGDDINLFDKDNVQYVGCYIDTTLVSHYAYRTIYIPCKANTSYTIQRPSGTSGIVLGYTTEVPAEGTTVQGKVTETTITTGANAKYLVCQVYRSTTDTATWEEIIDTIKIQEGKIATAYSPYGCGSVEIEKANKNLLKGFSTPTNDSSYWWDINRNYFTHLEDGWGRFEYDNTNGDSNVFINAKVKLDAMRLKENTLYSFIAEIRNSSISENAGAFFQLVTSNATTAFKTAVALEQSQINKGGIFKLTSTTKESFEGLNTSVDSYLRLATGTKGTVEIRLSVIEGDIDINNFDYTLHQSETYIFPLAEGQVLHEGDYLAEDGIHSKRKTIVLDGSDDENWLIETTTNYIRFYIQLNDNYINTTSRQHVLSNYFKYGTKNTIGTIFIYNKYLYIYPSSDITTIEDWKNWLSNHNTIVEYELAEPVITEYTEEQQTVYNNILNSNTYKNITHISAKGDIKPTLEVDYYKDLDTVFNNLANAIVALGGVI